MQWEVEYYNKENGKTPVLEHLLGINPNLRAKAYRDIKLLEKYGFELGKPYISSIKGKKYQGIYEIRSKFGTDISRILYFSYIGNTFVLLNGFVKKSEKTPERELERAKRYKEDYERRMENE